MTDEKKPDENKEESLLKFPSEFVIKVFGDMDPDFERYVADLIRPLAPNLSSGSIQSRTSENGKYLSLSITLYIESREQLDNIYLALTSSPKVLMAL